MDLLDRHRDTELTIDELAAAAGDLLAAREADQPDGRVSAAPDARSIRYYQQLGIVSPPARYDGRRAVYGYRHLLQLLATKKLQARGLSLAQVQRALAGADTRRLEAALTDADAAPRRARSMPERPGARPRGLAAAEVAPGVFVTIDPAVVRDAERVLHRISRALTERSAESGGRE